MGGQVNVLPQMLKHGVARYVDNVLVDKNNDPIPVGGGANAYLYKAYASDAAGTGFSLAPSAGLYFVAFKRTTAPIASPVVGDFAGLWLDTRGLPGTPGASSYKYRAFASAADGTGFTLTENPALAYVAEINTNTPIVSPVLGDFAGLFVKRIGQDGASSYRYRAFASDAVGTDFTMTDNPALAYVAEINTNTPIASPILDNFAGLFIKRTGTDGLTGSQGNKAGSRYEMASSTTIANPGVAFIRFNSAVPVSVTHMAMNIVGKNSINYANTLATLMLNDVVIVESNSNTGTAYYTAMLTGIAFNAVQGWYDFTLSYIGGTLPAANEQIVIRFVAGGIRVDAQGNLRDAQGNIISGMLTGTHAQMLALNPANYANEFFHVTDYGPYGIRYKCNGTIWIPDGDQLLYSGFPDFTYVAPNTQASGSIANNGGRVQIQATAHLLTQQIAITDVIAAAGPAMSKPRIHISAWSGTGVTGFYPLYSVDSADLITIDLAYAAGLGLPTLTLKNVEITPPVTVTLPPLNDFSEVLYEPEYIYTASGNNKWHSAYLGDDRISRPNNTTANSVFAKALLGFRNCGSKNVQETTHGEASATGNGTMTSLPLRADQNTAVPTTLSFRIHPLIANEVIGFKHLTVRLRG